MSEMSDTEFLDYCYWHSKTERAGFVGSHVARILRLAGQEEKARQFEDRADSIFSVPDEVMHPLVAQARGRPPSPTN
jgi:hypothetical protein